MYNKLLIIKLSDSQVLYIEKFAVLQSPDLTGKFVNMLSIS